MVILGSTGSIGVNALKVAQVCDIRIKALVCGSNVELLNIQIKEFSPCYVGLMNENKLPLLKPRDSKVFVGREGVLEILRLCRGERVLNAIVGFAGLEYSIMTLSQTKGARLKDSKKSKEAQDFLAHFAKPYDDIAYPRLILANKESLVVGGSVISKAINVIVESGYVDSKKSNASQNAFKRSDINSTKSSGAKEVELKDFKDGYLQNLKSNRTLNPAVRPQGYKPDAIVDSRILTHIFPVDSEHFGLYVLLQNYKNDRNLKVKKMYITASGGALRDFTPEAMKEASLRDVLAHPTWDMGAKITIDSATLVNKLYEILEGYWLFGSKKIDALIERESLVHSLIESKSGEFYAYISPADMRVPLFYGMYGMSAGGKDSKDSKLIKKFRTKKMGIDELTRISFRKIDSSFYPLWTLKNMLLDNPSLGVVLNAGNEVLQNLFLHTKIRFSEFFRILPLTLEHFNANEFHVDSMEKIYDLREETINFINYLLKK